MSLSEVVADAPLVGRVALVTGAARGVGRACAVALARAGCLVAACDVGDTDGAPSADADATAVQCAQESGKAQAFAADATDAAAVERLWVDVTAALGAPVVLVNAPGGALPGPMGALSPDEWQAVVREHLDAAFYCARAVLPAMRAAGFGRILNVALAPAGEALVSFTRKWAMEEAGRGITVNAVVSGLVESDELDPALVERWSSAAPLGRLARAEEVARVVAFLASPASSAITGARLDVGTPWSW
jgi:NAD(P)-dependent dehydrogenase (short-subunit alcohol dehydrogenase family)